MNVKEILDLLHKSVKKKNYDIVPTVKNRNSKRKYGLTILEIEDFLMDIKEQDLFKEPVKDIDIPDEDVYIFKKQLKEGVIFYIKIKKDNTVSYDRIKILSIHKEEVLGGI